MRAFAMRRTVPAFALASLLCTARASAQMDKLKSTTPEERASAQTAYLQSNLALAADQTPRVSALNRKYAQQMDPILKGSDGPLVKMRPMRGIQQAKEAELQTILTPGQFQKYLALKDEMREKIEQKLEQKAAGGGS